MFDEPTNALDEDGQQFMINLITDLKAKGKTILVSSHDAMFLKSVSNKLLYFNDGKVTREEDQQWIEKSNIVWFSYTNRGYMFSFWHKSNIESDYQGFRITTIHVKKTNSCQSLKNYLCK